MPRTAKHSMQPARHIVDLFGGCRALGRTLGISASTVSRWTTAKENDGTGGRIPQKYWDDIVANAKRAGKTITANDLASLR